MSRLFFALQEHGARGPPYFAIPVCTGAGPQASRLGIQRGIQYSSPAGKMFIVSVAKQEFFLAKYSNFRPCVINALL